MEQFVFYFIKKFHFNRKFVFSFNYEANDLENMGKK